MKFLLHPDPVRLLHPVCLIDTTEYIESLLHISNHFLTSTGTQNEETEMRILTLHVHPALI